MPVHDRLQQVEVGHRRVSCLDLLQELHHPARSLAARRALAARLVHVELRRPQRELHHAAAVVDDDERRGAEERARGLDRVVVERRVELVGRQRGHGRAAGDDALQLPSVRNAAGDVVHELPHRSAEHELVVARPLDVAGDREDGRARRRLRADLRELGGAELHDDRHRRDRADVVDLRRRVVEPLHGRERRPRARLAATPFQRVEQRRLLAADVRAGAAVDEDVAGAEDACLPRLVDGRLEDLVLGEVLAADVDEDAVGFDRVRRDEAAFDQPVRHAAHHLAVLEGARLRLVGVHDEVRRLAALAVDERGLAAHREAGAAAAAEVRLLQLGDEVVGRHRACLLDALVAADGPVLRELRQVALAGAREQGLKSRHGAPRRCAGTSSGFTGWRWRRSTVTTGA